jgi:hypothetical protein
MSSVRSSAALGHPTFEGFPNLPFMRALVKETLRWRPAAPLGIAHTTTEVSFSYSMGGE